MKTVDQVLHRFQQVCSSGHLIPLQDLCQRKTERQVLLVKGLLVKGLQVLLVQSLQVLLVQSLGLLHFLAVLSACQLVGLNLIFI